MKTFPHQINQIHKLVGALEVIESLNNSGLDVSDDGILGYELARRYIYTFRNYNENIDIEEKIRQEQEKRNSSQGARTCARDLRRLFLLLGFINTEFEITELGEMVLRSGGNIEDNNVCVIWREVLENMQLYSDNGQVSHPYRIMIRLVSENNGLISSKLALALEAEDDTEEEFNRILEILRQENWEESIYATTHQLRNAVKILPALARQIGDITVIQNQCYISTGDSIESIDDVENEDRVLEENDSYCQTHRQARRNRRVTADEIATIPRYEDEESSGSENIVDLSSANRTRLERFARHNNLVRLMAELLQNSGYEFIEDPMDCLAISSGRNSILIEAKTLNGSSDDERKQVRLALAQLLYYEAFNLDIINNESNICKIALFERQISEMHIQFLESYDCLVVWFENNELVGSERAIQFLQDENIIIY